MIYRNCQTGQKLDVAGLNEITVIIDRSETERTEVAVNSWRPGLDGPPHKHERKEQIFFILNGTGNVKIGSAVFGGKPGDLFYIPANVIHQTVNTGKEPFEYLLFNAFLDPDKEGHASFAEHVEKVKGTRKLQAETQHSNAGLNQPEISSHAKGMHVAVNGADRKQPGFSLIKLLTRNETQRCEAILVFSPPDKKNVIECSGDTERTLFVVAGSGFITVDKEVISVKPGDVVYVPRKSSCVVKTNFEELKCLSLNTIIIS
jgi:mannose-6-phosphate isomerase-like protein (cupin superfamily)